MDGTEAGVLTEPLPHYLQGVGCCSSDPEFMAAVSG